MSCLVGSSSSYSYSASAGEMGGRSQKKRVVTIGAISLAGGVALSAINDLAIFHGCTRSVCLVSASASASASAEYASASASAEYALLCSAL